MVWKTSYVYLGGRLLATTSGAGGAETRFHHPDRLGTRLVTDAGGTVVSEQFALPFGNIQPFTSAYGGENPYQNPTLSNPSKKRFTTYDRSEATGLDYAVNRFYSPQQGRFTQVDPIGMSATRLDDPQTLNMYAYCGNDPINCVDPSGLLFGWLKKAFGWVGKIFKWVAIAATIAVAVLTIIPAAWAGVALGKMFAFAAAHKTLAGIIGLGGLAGKYGGLGTPPTFPGASSGSGVGGFLSGFQDSDTVYDTDFVLKIATSEPGPLTKRLIEEAVAFLRSSPDEPDHLEMGITYGALVRALARWGLRFGKGSGGAAGRAASGAARSSRILTFTQRNLQKGFTKHGADFGLKGNWNPSRGAEFSAAVNQHINSVGVRVISGSYRSVPGYTHYLNPHTGLNVVADSAGNYVTGFRLGANQLRDVLTTGNLW